MPLGTEGEEPGARVAVGGHEVSQAPRTGGSTASACRTPNWQPGQRSISMPQEKRADGLDLVGGGRRGLMQQGAALGERGRPAPIGEQAEVTDADEAVGDD